MKVRIQAAGATGSVEVAPSTLAGLRSLYHGIHIPLMTAGGMQSINFGIYDLSRRAFRSSFPDQTHLSSVFLGGAVSGTLTSVLSTPVMLMKIQMQTHKHLTLREILMRDVYKTGRWRILYRGLGISAFSDFWGRGIYMFSYEAAKSAFALQQRDSEQPLPLHAKVLSASFAGVSTWFIMFPFDTLKTLVQSSYDGPSAREHLTAILRSGRARSILYRGCMYAVIRAAPVAATILPLYDASYEAILKSLE